MRCARRWRRWPRKILPVRSSAAPGPGLSQSRRRAAFIMSCRLARMYSWTPNMPVSAAATVDPTRNSLASVISVPTSDRAIVDAGLKSYSAERGPPWVHDRPDVEVTGVSDEHGKLKVGPRARLLSLGEKLWLIPGHCDPTVNLHDWYVGVRNGRVETLWPINARGA